MSPLPSGTRFPIQVISTIKPANGAGFPVVSDTDVEGGYQVRETLIDRDSIPSSNRKEGMLVFVKENQTFYTLNSGIGNINWVIKNFTSLPNYDLTGYASEPTSGRANNFPVGEVNTSGYLASVPPYTDSHIFVLSPTFPIQAGTDGGHLWCPCGSAIVDDEANFTKSTLVENGASYGLNYYSDLENESTGTSAAVNLNYSPYLFVSDALSPRILVIDRATDKVIGIGETNPDHVVNDINATVIDSDGNIWVSSDGISNHVSRFVTQDLIDNYPTPVAPSHSFYLGALNSALAYDGTYIWAVGGTFIERINATTLTYADGYDSLVGNYKNIIVQNGYIYVTSGIGTDSCIQRFNVSTFSSSAVADKMICGFGGYFGAIYSGLTYSNGFIWATDANTSLNNIALYQYDLELGEVSSRNLPAEISTAAALTVVSNPIRNEIYIVAIGISDGYNGVYTFNTETLTFTSSKFYNKNQPAQIKSVPASCLNAERPENPFVGQMVFVTDGAPLPKPLWWTGTSWVDATGAD